MKNKEFIEKSITKLFLERKENIEVELDDLKLGNANKNHPDILYGKKGIEVGAVLSSINTQIDLFDRIFFNQINRRIRNRIPNNLSIGLVMQDDKEYVKYVPSKAFSRYSYLPKYLYSIFVNKSEHIRIRKAVYLNQKLGKRARVFPNFKKLKEFNGFIRELGDYVISLKNKDYTHTLVHSGFKMHNAIIAEGTTIKSQKNQLQDYVSNKVIEKLQKDKYKGDYKEQILILHNYSELGNTEFSTDMHFYSHNKNDIFNMIFDNINLHNSFKFFNGIYFLDFSQYATNSNFELIDFQVYTKRESSPYTNGYEEIRVNLANQN